MLLLIGGVAVAEAWGPRGLYTGRWLYGFRHVQQQFWQVNRCFEIARLESRRSEAAMADILRRAAR